MHFRQIDKALNADQKWSESYYRPMRPNSYFSVKLIRNGDVSTMLKLGGAKVLSGCIK